MQLKCMIIALIVEINTHPIITNLIAVFIMEAAGTVKARAVMGLNSSVLLEIEKVNFFYRGLWDTG